MAAGGALRLHDRLELATEIAVQAGAVLLHRQGDAGAVEYKTTDTDPVSEADKAAERLINAALERHCPEDGILGEEGSSRPGTSGLRWVVDPLDGTVNYLYGHPTFAVSIACENDDGAAIVGVVHQPAAPRTFAALHGGEATLDGRTLRVNDPVELSRALVGTGFAYGPDERARQAAVVAALLPQVRDIRRIGSAALDLCMVAAGQLDGYFEDSTRRWDWAAGRLIATQAGAVVGHSEGGIAAAGPALFEPLRAALAAQGVHLDDGIPPP